MDNIIKRSAGLIDQCPLGALDRYEQGVESVVRFIESKGQTSDRITEENSNLKIRNRQLTDVVVKRRTILVFTKHMNIINTKSVENEGYLYIDHKDQWKIVKDYQEATIFDSKENAIEQIKREIELSNVYQLSNHIKDNKIEFIFKRVENDICIHIEIFDICYGDKTTNGL